MSKCLYINVENSETGTKRSFLITDIEASEISLVIDGQTAKVYTGKNFKSDSITQLSPPEQPVKCLCPACNKDL